MHIFRKGLFEGQVAIVTGGGSGIGFSTAKALLELGAKVAICSRKKEKIDAAADKLRAVSPDGVFADTCDIREYAQVEAFSENVKVKLGTASVLINNAGGQFPTTAENLAPKGWEAVIRNNLHGTFYFTQVVGTKHMIPAKKGRIVNVIAQIARGFPTMVHTGAARAGVENMTKTLAVEWAQHNIQVNAVAPGVIKTSGTDQYPPEVVELGRKANPMQRMGTAGEVAQLILYLASDAAWFVNGACWYTDGGAQLWGDTWKVEDQKLTPPALIEELSKPE